MRRTLAALVVLCLIPGLAHAQLEINNIRPAYGPLGAKRTGTKFLPGDVVWLNYDIDGLSFDKTTGKANYETKLEFFDANGKLKFDAKTPNSVTADLGGTRMPGELHVVIGAAVPPGKYTIKATISDNISKAKKAFSYDIEVLQPDLGFIGVMAPAFGLPGQHYLAEFALVGMKLDAKDNPNVDVTIRILDASNKPVTTPVTLVLPDNIPPGVNVKKLQYVPLSYPLYLNRSGRFQIEITAVDKNNSKKQASMRFPLVVVDIPTITGEK